MLLVRRAVRRSYHQPEDNDDDDFLRVFEFSSLRIFGQERNVTSFQYYAKIRGAFLMDVFKTFHGI